MGNTNTFRMENETKTTKTTKATWILINRNTGAREPINSEWVEGEYQDFLMGKQNPLARKVLGRDVKLDFVCMATYCASMQCMRSHTDEDVQLSDDHATHKLERRLIFV